MYVNPLDHVGIAVHSIDDAIPIWEAIIGTAATGRETLESQGVEVAFVGSGVGRIELIAPARPDSTVSRFLEKRGPGLHHVCYRVRDIRAAIADYTAAGFEPIDPEPRIGAENHLVAFLHPRATKGVLIELSQAKDESTSTSAR